jgi:hypothetical protein
MRAVWKLASLLWVCPVLALAQQPPAAARPHTIDMTAPLLDDRGKPGKDCAEPAPDGKACAVSETLTLGVALSRLLFSVTDADRGLSGDQRWARGVLAAKIKDAKAVALTAEEVALIKRLVGQSTFSPLIVMQIFPALDPNDKPPPVQP